MLSSRERRQRVADGGTVAVHPHQRRDVGGRAEKTGVARHAAHREGVLVVHLTPQALSPPVPILFGRGALHRRARAVVGALRFDGPQDPLTHKVGECRIARPREAGGQHDVAEVAVPKLADVLGERLLGRELDELVR